jgi:hypothetical protein
MLTKYEINKNFKNHLKVLNIFKLYEKTRLNNFLINDIKQIFVILKILKQIFDNFVKKFYSIDSKRIVK